MAEGSRVVANGRGSYGSVDLMVLVVIVGAGTTPNRGSAHSAGLFSSSLIDLSLLLLPLSLPPQLRPILLDELLLPLW